MRRMLERKSRAPPAFEIGLTATGRGDALRIERPGRAEAQ